ncbi:MAG: Uma2 family endonuclease [Caldilineaceae bacterium]
MIPFTRTTPVVIKRGSVPHLPDLAVEIKSPDDSVRKLRESGILSGRTGLVMVWLIYPEQGMVEVYTPDGDVAILLRGWTTAVKCCRDSPCRLLKFLMNL